MTLGWNQSDMDIYDYVDEEYEYGKHNFDNKRNISSTINGCKLRAEEGLDAISSLAPPEDYLTVLAGHSNTVFAWLVQWLSDNLGYDVTNMIALPYDWRLTPNVMQSRDGFFTQM